MAGSIATHSTVMYIIIYIVTGVLSQFLPPSLYQNPGMPGAMSPPMGNVMMPPMQMPGYPQQRLPVMVMPFHSKLADRKYIRRKKRKPKRIYTDSDSGSGSESDSSSSSNEHLRTHKHRTSHRRKRKRQVLTPVISYVTRNGRVVYQKRIKKENAGDWLEIGKRRIPSKLVEEEEKNSGEMTIREMKNKYGIRHNHHDHEELH